MPREPRTGRPRASSRETLAEAACELFLERGFEQTSIADIASRAGVSRSSFFNYFASKSDILWSALDERVRALEERLRGDGATSAAASATADASLGASGRAGGAASAVTSALTALGAGFTPDSLALAVVNTDAMGLEAELEREASVRRSRIAAAVATRLHAAGVDRLEADVAGAAHGGAVLAAIEAWAHGGAGRAPLAGFLARALVVAAPTLPTAVRQLRVVARAERFDEALAFYRDELGLVERESHEGEGDARVAILAAGEATLELSNAGQVALIDRVETDGDAPSDAIRLAFEVGDADGMTERLVAAGAKLEASARQTPWRSLNSRLRGPAGLQITLFQELGPAGEPDSLT
ncbi:TetR family transcriptional regulator [Microbacterium sp. BK668]|uniref:TetR family transcriptional regulator n=1 Tax=Microbacterium sp. BK668 TaxID=2512118 RepID=UPI00105E0BE0|nr:TetR family transcriptional regulator [Microbacterium sp. BK668]TDN92677.1 TetR family transcriptional regulator [Microbacterium sp. BK668]